MLDLITLKLPILYWYRGRHCRKLDQILNEEKRILFCCLRDRVA